uniref:Uncharacterized protein n=1 Tax=Rhizophora mucronata TaxID=61149 RepID=A0A2P2PQQ6_RHIMU
MEQGNKLPWKKSFSPKSLQHHHTSNFLLLLHIIS